MRILWILCVVGFLVGLSNGDLHIHGDAHEGVRRVRATTNKNDLLHVKFAPGSFKLLKLNKLSDDASYRLETNFVTTASVSGVWFQVRQEGSRYRSYSATKASKSKYYVEIDHLEPGGYEWRVAARKTREYDLSEEYRFRIDASDVSSPTGSSPIGTPLMTRMPTKGPVASPTQSPVMQPTVSPPTIAQPSEVAAAKPIGPTNSPNAQSGATPSRGQSDVPSVGPMQSQPNSTPVSGGMGVTVSPTDFTESPFPSETPEPTTGNTTFELPEWPNTNPTLGPTLENTSMEFPFPGPTPDPTMGNPTFEFPDSPVSSMTQAPTLVAAPGPTEAPAMTSPTFPGMATVSPTFPTMMTGPSDAPVFGAALSPTTQTAASPPTSTPSPLPTPPPTLTPILPPTMFPILPPTMFPILPPTMFPTLPPTISPTLPPTISPTLPPTPPPTSPPTSPPTPPPTSTPTSSPTLPPIPPPSLPPTPNPTPEPPTPKPTVTPPPTFKPAPPPTPPPVPLPTPQSVPPPTPVPAQPQGGTAKIKYGLQDNCRKVDANKFNICLDLKSPSGQYERWMDAVGEARDRWQRIILAGRRTPADIRDFFPTEQIATELPPLVDDVYVAVDVVSIDGPGGVLGMAGPNLLMDTRGNSMAVSGVMKFDWDDVVEMTDEKWKLVILHELGHVLGFGTLFQSNDLHSGSLRSDFYKGKYAEEEWDKMCPGGRIPIETEGGEGTAGGHWDEECLRGELMTGYLSAKSAIVSRMTIASMKDLGYTVNMDAADKYTTADLGDCGGYCPKLRRALSPEPRYDQRKERLSKAGHKDVLAVAGKELTLRRARAPTKLPANITYIGGDRITVFMRDYDGIIKHETVNYADVREFYDANTISD